MCDGDVENRLQSPPCVGLACRELIASGALTVPGNVVRLELFTFQAAQVLERSSFLQFMCELYQHQLYPSPIVFTTTPSTLPLRVGLGVTWKQFGVSAEIEVPNPVTMATGNT